MTEGAAGFRRTRFPARATRVLLFTSLALLTSCNRKPHLVPAAADSTAAIPHDSTALYVQMARDAWQNAEEGAHAADLTARLILDRMRGDKDQTLGGAARDFVDSLGMGAEVAGRDPAVVNLFSRSDPTGGSWPFVFWREGAAVHYQPLDASGLHLSGTTLEASQPSKAQRFAALFSGSGPTGQQPFAFVWERPPGAASWRLAQSLGTDSLGRTGNAKILDGAGPDGAVLETRTYTVEHGFDECASCPHVYKVRRFKWDAPGLVTATVSSEHTPYAAFVALVTALAAGNRAAAAQLVSDPGLLATADGYAWGVSSKGRWRLAPGTNASATELLVFRGAQEAYRVHFMPRGEDWVVSAFEPASRSVE